ncbi:MAG: 4-hydroxy-3-methylbut-2-enyl diphosphate reductase [Candidatus Stahlbacteria bacterium]|nr:4-hydroxy-3-methylbut-2-enyl diphosphate reductase [Candidatus Stahlbacteria bacterium]
MKILHTPEHGFCFGVRRSIDIANRVIKEAGVPVYTYGPIIHNPQVIDRLKASGVIPIESLDAVGAGKLIIRSHGVPLSVITEASERGFSVIDATCPFVKRAQEYAKKLLTEGYKVVIVGESEHPEVQGILGHIGNQAEIISDLAALAKVKKENKIGVIVQTTLSVQRFKDAVAHLLMKAEELRVYNTICKDVISRQKHTVELAKKVDIMIVVGGRNSANTRRLVELAHPCPTYHIETVDEIDTKWFSDKHSVGITSGASTPDWIIDEVIEKVTNI